jgi:HEAT repeat protein
MAIERNAASQAVPILPPLAPVNHSSGQGRRRPSAPTMPAPNPALEPLVTRLGSPNAEDRWHAAQSLAAFGRAAVPSLLLALQHSDPYVRRHAAEVLGRVGGDQATEALIIRLSDPSAIVRERAAEALTALGRPEARYALQIVLVADTVANVRALAAEGLGRIQGKSTVVPLIAGTRDASPMVRWSVAGALANTQSRRAVRPLIGLLTDPDEGVRCAAANALARLGSRRAAEPLAAAMRDTDPNVRWHAVDALSCLHGPRIVQFFFSALDDPDPGVRWRAASALGDTARGYAAVVEGLIGLLGDVDANVRAHAAEALGKLRDPRALPRLRELLSDAEQTRFLGRVSDVAWVAVHKLERVARRQGL